MRTFLGAALLASAAIAEARSLLEVRLEIGRGDPEATSWLLAGPSGRSDTIFLGSEVLLDETVVATADAGEGPGGAAEIRLTLTPDGARKLQQITARSVGKRLGIVLAGRLRAAPTVLAPVANGVLVVSGGLTDAEASALARRLGPPAPPAAAGVARPPSAALSPLDASARRDLRGTWRVLDVNGGASRDAKLAQSTWTFQDEELSVTNGEGQTARFSLRMEGGSPRALFLAPLPPSKEHGGWILYAREADVLRLAFGDNLSGRPADFTPAPKTIVLRLARP